MPKSKPAQTVAKTKKSAPAKPAKKAPKADKPAKVVAKSRVVVKASKPAQAKVAKAKPVKALKVKAGKAKPVAEPAKAKTKILKLAAPKAGAKVNGVKKGNHSSPPANHVKPIIKPIIKPSLKSDAAADAKLSPFLKKQKERLVALRDSMLDSMLGVAKDTLRSRAEGSEASAFGMHQADAGSDAYDRDFALSLLSQEQDALYEIEEAIKRIGTGTYGMCEMSGKPIAHARLEAIPFTRYTVECQSQLEKQNRNSRTRVPVTSLFGLTDDEGNEKEEEEETPTEKAE